MGNFQSIKAKQNSRMIHLMYYKQTNKYFKLILQFNQESFHEVSVQKALQDILNSQVLNGKNPSFK